MRSRIPHPTQSQLQWLFGYESGQIVFKQKTASKVVIGRSAGYTRPDGYHVILMARKVFYRHRLVWIWHYGDIPDGYVVDHINDLPGDDRIENLQLLTHSENTKKGKR